MNIDLMYLQRTQISSVSQESTFVNTTDIGSSQRGCGCPIHGGIQDQVGWSRGQPGLVLDMEVGGRGVET